jgi:Gram-negative bacterial TonB protein C-terminal
MTVKTIHLDWCSRFICLWLFAVTATDIAAQDSAANATTDTPAASATSPEKNPEAPPGDTQTIVNLPADDATVSATVPARDPQNELEEARALYAAAFAAKQYRSATDSANRMIALASEFYGKESVEYALAKCDLAAAQSKLDDLTAAAANYRQAISLIEQEDGIVSPQLIQPLMGLASVQNAAGEWDQGLETYNRALRLNHVEYGLNNLGQMPIRDGLTESYLGLGSIKDANFQQELQLRIVRDEFGDDLPKLTEAANKLAGWYQRSNQQEKEVLQLEASVRTIRSKMSANDPAQIQVLRDLAAAYQRLDLSPEQQLSAYSASLDALNEAWRINNDSDNPDQIVSAEIQIEIGDTHSTNGQTRAARSAYLEAWQIFAYAGTEADVIDTYFGKPTHIGSRRLPDVYPDNRKTRELWNSNPDRFRPGSLQALVDIDDYGLTSNIRITESNPQGLLDDTALAVLKRYRFRPRFAGGQPVATSNLQISHAFSHLPVQQDSAADSAEDSDSDSAPPLVNPQASQ